mgnify:CR=1 FL=1
MRVADLLEEFTIVIDTKEGLSELRSLILGLAVRGKLVPQDPNDEPASELLKKIEDLSQSVILEREVPFEIPSTWEWVPFGKILDFKGGSQPPKDHFIKEPKEGYVQLIQIRDLGEKPQPVYVPKDLVTKFCSTEDIMIGRYGASVGKVFWGKDGAYNVALIKILFDKENMDRVYLFHYFNSDLFQRILAGISRSAQAGFNKGNILPEPFPLPPLAEQHRIVQKIETLFTEVDELEAKLNRQTKMDTRLQLAVNAEVQQAPDSAASKTAWNFITNNFETLYHTPEAIDNLKKNILNEAVRGRLVPQNPTDEPASELLKKIEAEKQRLYEAGEIRKPKALPPITEEEIPFEIPESWEWVKLADISISFNNGISKRSGKEGQEIPVIRLADIENLRVDLSDTRSIKLTDKELKTYLLTNDDILITRVNGSIELVGSFNIFKENKVIAYCDHFVRMNINCELIDVSFIWFSGKTSLIRAQIESQFITTAGQKTVNQRHLGNLVLPLPPLAEQHRIVQRIEELFAICDRFKTQLEQRQAVNEQLVKGLVKEVLEGV